MQRVVISSFFGLVLTLVTAVTPVSSDIPLEFGTVFQQATCPEWTFPKPMVKSPWAEYFELAYSTRIVGARYHFDKEDEEEAKGEHSMYKMQWCAHASVYRIHTRNKDNNALEMEKKILTLQTLEFDNRDWTGYYDTTYDQDQKVPTSRVVGTHPDSDVDTKCVILGGKKDAGSYLFRIFDTNLRLIDQLCFERRKRRPR